jgi:acyl-CoA reductase-like NAD-dependent aldehyde dehydrogenase
MVNGPDMDMALRGLAYTALINAGQVYSSTERVYV